MPSICQQLQQEYQTLKTFKQEFDLAFEKAQATGKVNDIEQAKKLMGKLKEKREALEEKLWPFESLPQRELKEQYESQREILDNAGILEKLSNGELGITGIDNREYTFPSYREIAERMRKNKEIIKTKSEQGFNQLLITPFGMKLDDLIEKYKQVILKHHKKGKLFATKENPSDPDEQLGLNENEPVWVWDKYQSADETGELVYYPQEFSDNHQGKTKQDILEKQGKTHGAGFNIIFIEDMPNIPRQIPAMQEPKGGRMPIDTQGSSIKKYIKSGETIPSPNEYLKAINTEPVYRHEIGMTPEDQLVYAILFLAKHNQVVDDYQGKGSISYQIGAYFPAFGYVPDAYWDRNLRRAGLARGVSGSRNDHCGVRPVVRVS